MMMVSRDPHNRRLGLTESGVRLVIAIVSAAIALAGSFVGVMRFVHYGDIATHSELVLHEERVANEQQNIAQQNARQDSNIALLLARTQVNHQMLCALLIAPVGAAISVRSTRALQTCIDDGVLPR